MKTIIYILTFTLLIGMSSFTPNEKCRNLKVNTSCDMQSASKEEKGCCDSEKEINCECCKILAIPNTTAKTESMNVPKNTLIIEGEHGSPKTFHSDHFHPPQFV